MESSMKRVKKTNDTTKIKKFKVKTKGLGLITGLREVGAASSVQTVHSIPQPSRLREDARIQDEVQNRLRHLEDNVKQGMDKIKSQRGGATRSDGLMNLSCQVKIKIGSLTINCSLSNGWLIFIRPSGRSQI